jgi:sporulation integral membrane protein YtvI
MLGDRYMKEHYVIDPGKLKKTALVALGIAIGLFLLYKSLYYFAPFIIAFMLASLIEPVIKLMVNKMKLPRSLASFISLILVLTLLGYLISLIVSKSILELKGVATILPQYLGEAYRNITGLISEGNNVLITMPPEVTENVGGIISSLFSYLTNTLNTFAKSLSGVVISTAASLPGALVFLLTTILSTYFLSSGRHEIVGFLRRTLPLNWYNKIFVIRDELFTSAFKLVKAYLIIMSITFTELLIGFSIIKLKYAFILAIIIAIIDILPVLGTGGVLIPWVLYSFLTKNTRMGLYLLIIYLIILIIRQIVEPKIIGHQIGTHPLVTLITMYLGFKLIGAAGLILGPITVLILKGVLSGILKGRPIKDFVFRKIEHYE